MRYLSLPLTLLIALASCMDRPGYVKKEANGGDPIYSVNDDDAAMDAAMAKAVQTFPDFLKAFAAQDTSNSEYTVKYRFFYGPGGDGVEHMWLSDLHYKNDKLFGLLNNSPARVVRHEEGDTIEIKMDMVSDWMYVRDGNMIGGYTMHVLYDKMTAEEKKEFASQMPFKIE